MANNNQMKKNILYDLQLSVLTSQEDGDFIFNTDSNVNVASFTIAGLLKKNPDYEIYLMIPEEHKIVNPGQFFDDKRIHVINYPYFGNPFVERVSFNPREMMELLGDIHIDLVYTNDPSKVLTYKTFFYMKQGEFVPIISRNHWVTGKLHRKVPEEIDFITRQVEGAIYSDYSTFNSKTAIDMLLSNADEFYNEETIENIRGKCSATETVDLEKIDRHRVEVENKIPVILFAHRLSYYTGFEEVLSVLDELFEEGLVFQLYLPDPGNKSSQEELNAKHPYLMPIDKNNWSHEDYIELCWKADIAIGNHNIPTTWGGLALTEPMAAFTAPLMPDKDGYIEMFYNEPDCYFEDRDDMKKKLIHLLQNPDVLEEKKKLARQFCEEELSMEKYINDIDKLIQTCI